MAALCNIHFILFSIFIGVFIAPHYALAQDEPPLIVGEDTGFISPNIEELKVFDSDVEQGDNGVSISAPSASKDAEMEDSFFDANDLVPQGEMSRKGLVKVDPKTQPASKFIIIKKTHNIDEKVVRLVYAERAMSLGRLDSALLMFDSLYDKNKRDTRVLMGRAIVLQKLGRFDEAMQMYEALSKLDPNNVDANVNMLGLLGTKYPAVALRRLLTLYDDNKSNVGVVSQLAILHAKTGDVRSALSYLGVAASMEPQNASHLFNMAIIADRAGETDRAVEYYDKALDVDTIYGAGRSIPRDVIYERLALIR